MAVFALVNTEVILRSFTKLSITWVIEFSEYALLFITFLLAPWLLKRSQHVKVDLVVSKLNPGPKALLNSITSIIGAVICLTVTWYGSSVTWDHFQNGYMITEGYIVFPSFSIMLIIPVCSLLLSIEFLRKTYEYLRSWGASRTKEA
jgi:TRAP-type C4-dicarboxylate transport system permease small subunit